MEYLAEAWVDTSKLLPVLLVMYFIVAFCEYRYGDRMGFFLSRFGALGPVAGAVLGCIPQCGFSVVAAVLYARRLISTGTLLAVFLSTSDEAIPILISMPGERATVGLLVALKVLIAIIVGISVDLLLKERMARSLKDEKISLSSLHARPCGCCDHDIKGETGKNKTLFLHPLRHAVKIFVFLFVLTAVMNFVFEHISAEGVSQVFLRGTFLQPVMAAGIGLIPNCFASVFLVDLFSKGVISFGALLAGLCAGTGLGILALARENKNAKDTFLIVLILLGSGIAFGVVAQFIF